MRKNLKRKRRSCGLCKPHKTGIQRRWTPKEFDARTRAEREIRSGYAAPLADQSPR